MNDYGGSFTCRLAGVNIEIHSLFPQTRDFCKEYLTDGTADFTVSVSWKDIEAERKRAEKASLKEHGTVISYPEDYLETLAIYRKIATRLLDYNVLLFHGSALAMDECGYLFTAPSGTGKSTHTRLWREVFGKRAWIVNDDKPLLRLTEKEVYVCGTPWDGKHHLSRNAMVPLKSICLIERGRKNEIQPISAGDAMVVCLRQCFRPVESENMVKTLALLEKLLKHVRFYRLYCNMEPDAARIAYEGMENNQ